MVMAILLPPNTFQISPFLSPGAKANHHCSLQESTLFSCSQFSTLAGLGGWPAPATLDSRRNYGARDGVVEKVPRKLNVIELEHSALQTEKRTQPSGKHGSKKMFRTWSPGLKKSSSEAVQSGDEIGRTVTMNCPNLVEKTSQKSAVGNTPRTRSPHEVDLGITSTSWIQDSWSNREEGEDEGQAEEEFDGISQKGSTSDLNCLHFHRCSGCVFESELNKPRVLVAARAFFKAHGVLEFSFASKHLRAWRCRAKLAVRGTSSNPSIGLFEEETHEVVDIPTCQAHHPSINITVELLKKAIRDLGVQPYDELTNSGQLRYVQMIAATYDTSIPLRERYKNAKVQISLVWNSRNEDSTNAELLQELAKMLWQRGGNRSDHHLIHSIWANFQTTKGNVIFGGRWRHLFGEVELWEHLGGVDVCYMPSCFGQANVGAFQLLLRSLQKFVHRGAAVVDLYAGVGVIGLSLAATRNCRVVKCVETNKEARAAFQRSLSRMPKLVNCDLSWHCADVSVNPIRWLEGIDIVIVDPPRKGLGNSVIEALRSTSMRLQGKMKRPTSNTLKKVEKRPWVLRTRAESIGMKSLIDTNEPSDGQEPMLPSKLIYISCEWQSFQEDCEALEKDGLWHLHSAQAFNFFPGTDSIEVLAVFKVGKRPKRSAQKFVLEKNLKR